MSYIFFTIFYLFTGFDLISMLEREIKNKTVKYVNFSCGIIVFISLAVV